MLAGQLDAVDEVEGGSCFTARMVGRRVGRTRRRRQGAMAGWGLLASGETNISGDKLYSNIVIYETKRYGPLRGPTSSSCGGLRPRFFLLFLWKKELIMLFCPFYAIFCVQ